MGTQFIYTHRERHSKGDNLIAELTKIESPILAPFSPWYTYKAGHSPTFHLIALWDIDHEEVFYNPTSKTFEKIL